MNEEFITTCQNSHGFYIYLPKGYDQSSGSFPLMFFVHGLGELGDGSASQLPAVLRNGPPRLINAGTWPTSFTVNAKTSSFIIMVPQFVNIPALRDVDTVLQYTIQHYKVDISRIYMTGLSMGGGTAWSWAGVNSLNAGQLAALLPVCGAYLIPGYFAVNIASVNLPVYATHNVDDPTVPSSYTVDNVALINSQSPPPNPLAIDTIFNASGHDAWTKTYDPAFTNPRIGNLNVYQWLLQFQLGNTPLPVTYTDFEVRSSAVNDQSRVTIDWTTAREQNNHYYVIQRSTDGASFGPLDSVPATNLSTPHSYSYIDASPPTGHDFYRIQQVDLDGKTSLTGVKEVTVGVEGPTALRISPNPASGGMIYLEMGSPGLGALQVSITDPQGRTIRSWAFQKQGRQWSQSIDLGSLPAGNYFITVKGDNNTRQVRQFTKL